MCERAVCISMGDTEGRDDVNKRALTLMRVWPPRCECIAFHAAAAAAFREQINHDRTSFYIHAVVRDDSSGV